VEQQGAVFVSYGSAGGARAVEQLRLVMAEVQIATIRIAEAFSVMPRSSWRLLFLAFGKER
jgi:NAD(P)H-dependent FMN reductase